MTAQTAALSITPLVTAEPQALLERFATYLTRRGHAPRTRQMYLEVATHFLRWQAGDGASAGITVAIVRCFLDRHLPRCTCAMRGPRDRKTVRAALNQLLALSGEDRQRRPAGPSSAAIDVSVAAFDHYLLAARGLAASTRHARCRIAQAFLWSCCGERSVDVTQITASALVGFVKQQAQHLRPASVCSVTVALHSYLRFLQFCGHATVSLQGAVPHPPHYALAGLPTSLDAVERARFWAALDHATAMGKRDYAMARCLADLGLRCDEVAHLTLESIDWRNAQLRLAQTKMRRAAVLPLPTQTAAAILDYLQYGRPVPASRALFVHHRAPRGQAVRKTTVRAAIRQAFRRAGLPWSGTHILRRTLATRLLAHGAPLTEIAEVLRHRSIDTTRIYTKVDHTALAKVAQPWPGSVS